jgi:hypothetical protein
LGQQFCRDFQHSLLELLFFQKLFISGIVPDGTTAARLALAGAKGGLGSAASANLKHVVSSVSMLTFRIWRTDAQAKNALDEYYFSLILRCMEHLQTYLKTHKAKPLAEAVGISQSYLSDMKKGNRSPSLRVAVAIEDATDGAVPARSWLKQ